MSVTTMRRLVKPVPIAITLFTAVALVVFVGPLSANAAEPGDDDFLGTAEAYAIIASDTITETDTQQTTVVGDVALDPGTVVELLPVQVTGDIHISDTASTTADGDLNTAYVIVANKGATETVGTANLAFRVTPYLAGVYFSGSDLLLDGTITLSGGPDDVFIFQASTGMLTTGSGSVVLLVGGAQACNVYWQVGSSATLGTDSTFVGTLLAATSIAAQTGAQVQGQLLAGATNAGAVTLDNNHIDAASTCIRATSAERIALETAAAAAPAAASPGELAATGTESTVALVAALSIFLAGIGLVVLARRRSSARASA